MYLKLRCFSSSCRTQGFPGNTSNKEPVCQCRCKRHRFHPRLGRSSGGGHGKPPVLAWRIPWTETWQATDHRVANSQAQLKQLSMHSIEPKKREVLVYMPVFSLLLVPIHRTNRIMFLKVWSKPPCSEAPNIPASGGFLCSVWNGLLARLCLVAQLCLTLCDPMDYSLPGFFVLRDSPGKNTGVDCHALLQGIFPIQGSNPGLPHCRQILYRLNLQHARPLCPSPSPGLYPSSCPLNWWCPPASTEVMSKVAGRALICVVLFFVSGSLQTYIRMYRFL